MAHMHLDRVLEVVKSTGCTRMAAYDTSGYCIDQVEVDAAALLVEEIEDLVRNTSGTIRLDCWNAAPPKVPGTRKADQPKAERFTFHVRGQLGQAVAAPERATRPRGDANAEAVKYPTTDVETAVHMARMEWRLELLTEKLKERDEYEDPDEPDEPDEPPAPAGLFGMSPDQTFQFLSGLKEVVQPLLSPLAGRIAGTPPAPAAAPSLTDLERKLLEAFKRMAKEQPDTAQSIAQELLNNFGDQPKEPAPANGHAHG